MYLRKTLKMNKTGTGMLKIYLNIDAIQDFLNLYHLAIFIIKKYFKHTDRCIARIILQTSTLIVLSGLLHYVTFRSES